jgi:outer membrane lipoprotein carrier protein
MKLLLTLSALVMALNAEITLPNNFQSEFKQSITNDQGKVIKYDGNVIFNKITESFFGNAGSSEQSYSRSLFKWNYSSPTKKEVCTDGSQLIVIDHDLEQVSNYTVDEGIDLEGILKVAQKITNVDYKATYKETEYIITLDNSEQLSKIVYVDNLDNGVKIIFDNMNYNNASFDVTKLECHSPKEYDIIQG